MMSVGAMDGLPLGFAQVTEPGCGPGETHAISWWQRPGECAFALVIGRGPGDAAATAAILARDAVGDVVPDVAGGLPLAVRLRRAVQAANLALYEKAIVVPDLAGIEATVTCLGVAGATLAAAHVGDARVYRYRAGALVQLTKDHTWGWEAALAPEAPGADRRTRALGRQLVLTVDVLRTDVVSGDVVLQASRAVGLAVGEGEIAELLAAHLPEGACRALVRRTRQEGVTEPVSVQVAAVGGVADGRTGVASSRPAG
jgi:protein phosphatase